MTMLNVRLALRAEGTIANNAAPAGVLNASAAAAPQPIKVQISWRVSQPGSFIRHLNSLTERTKFRRMLLVEDWNRAADHCSSSYAVLGQKLSSEFDRHYFD